MARGRKKKIEKDGERERLQCAHPAADGRGSRVCLYWSRRLHTWATCAPSLEVAGQMKDTLYPRSAASALVPVESDQPAWRNKTWSDRKEKKNLLEFRTISEPRFPSVVLKLNYKYLWL